uniref:Uncharacterized protein n=1 Tax=Panagrolaimus superbus TaxID=310955 RepID=A0A914Z8I0_9BILA
MKGATSAATLVTLIFSIVFVNAALASDEAEIQRVARSFPFSLSMLRAMRPPQETEFNNSPRLLYPSLPNNQVEREIADIIESLDTDSYPRERRSAPIFKRYACRFKFCRIFDA